MAPYPWAVARAPGWSGRLGAKPTRAWEKKASASPKRPRMVATWAALSTTSSVSGWFHPFPCSSTLSARRYMCAAASSLPSSMSRSASSRTRPTVSACLPPFSSSEMRSIWRRCSSSSPQASCSSSRSAIARMRFKSDRRMSTTRIDAWMSQARMSRVTRSASSETPTPPPSSTASASPSPALRLAFVRPVMSASTITFLTDSRSFATARSKTW
mmetsp:Transcript_19203/g.51721  ORF Transcript_19203/g.51721 Transcript_19203/m.51721 type:complete len:214 (-) Transcript_19203:925-1566(-)